MHPGLGDRRLRGELGLHPFRIDVAAEGGDELVLLAPVQHQEAVLEVAEVAGRQPVARGRRLAEVAEHARAAHFDLAVGRKAHFGMRERTADRADAARARRVHAHHRGAFGQAVAFEGRNAEHLGAAQHAGRHARAADGGEAQTGRTFGALLHRGDQREQQLRQQDQAVRLAFVQRLHEARHIEAAGAAHAQRSLRYQVDAGAGQAGRIHPADVLQQLGQRYR